MSPSVAPQRSWGWLWILAGGALLTQTALNLVRPVTTYKLLALDADTTTIGLVTAAYALIPLLSALSLGRLSDRMRKLSRLVALGAALLGLGSLALALSTSIALVAGANALLGFGHLVFTIAGQTLITRHARPGQMNAAFGWFTAAFSAGQLAGPLIAGLLLGSSLGTVSAERSASITVALWVGAGLSLLAAPIVLIRTVRPPGSNAPATGTGTPSGGPMQTDDGSSLPARERATLPAILGLAGVPSHMLASLSLLAMLDILTAFLPLAGEEAGIPPAQVGVLLAIRGAASILSRSCLPWLSSRLSSRTLLLVSLYGSGVALIFPPLTVGQPWIVAPLLIVGGFCLGLGQPLTMTLVSTAVPDGWRGTALAVRLTGNRVGQVVMPITAGFLAAPLGAAGAIWFSCAVLLVSACEKTARR
ncbi:MFS transporter [Arthrobacter sedimenti]|uniref:MFS transporter n=1 Tax=Arthrobacter sedimenti TaxID=2694931 RepID=UPI000B35317B|nr:MFS transporter [Arthrobacter sedimenti]OUM45159.1 MFS transporter [Arthrobacter agilis]